MDDAHDGPYAREPQIEDLARICRALNDAGARYILIGGFAVIAHGGARTTKDIDLLVDASPDNIARVKQALRILEDSAVDEVAETDVARYAVVRVADEIVVDLMARACGIEYAEAARERGQPDDRRRRDSGRGPFNPDPDEEYAASLRRGRSSLPRRVAGGQTPEILTTGRRR